MNDHLISEFCNLGCTDDFQAFITLQVYLELCEVKRYWNVEYKFDETLKRLYLTAKKTKTGADYIFIPIAVSESLSFANLQELIALSENLRQNSIYLVMVASDSTSVYYRLVDGLEEPTDTSVKHLKVNKQEKLDADLKKNRALLEQSALYGIPITMTKSNPSTSGSTDSNR